MFDIVYMIALIPAFLGGVAVGLGWARLLIVDKSIIVTNLTMHRDKLNRKVEELEKWICNHDKLCGLPAERQRERADKLEEALRHTMQKLHGIYAAVLAGPEVGDDE